MSWTGDSRANADFEPHWRVLRRAASRLGARLGFTPAFAIPDRPLVQQDFARFVARYPAAALEQALRSLVERCDSMPYIADGYAPVLAARLKDMIAARRPASLIRLGDGEGNLLGALDPAFPALAAHSVAAIMDLMFGRPPRGDAEVAALRDGMVAAIEDADILGIPDFARLKFMERRNQVDGEQGDYGDTRGISGSAYALLGPVEQVRRSPAPIITNCYCHKDLLPFYRDLLGGLDAIGLVSCFAGLPERVQSAFSIGRVDFYEIPDQWSNPRPDGAGLAKTGHYPARFAELMRTMRIRREGQVFLIAAGILGKLYCNRLKSLGAVAIDIGSVADVWMGQPVRLYHDSDFIAAWQL